MARRRAVRQYLRVCLDTSCDRLPSRVEDWFESCGSSVSVAVPGCSQLPHVGPSRRNLHSPAGCHATPRRRCPDGVSVITVRMLLYSHHIAAANASAATLGRPEARFSLIPGRRAAWVGGGIAWPRGGLSLAWWLRACRVAMYPSSLEAVGMTEFQIVR